jgi:ElaB/YqjD/DUF883 family membrane-anchored ribosome-binding protein
MLFNLCIFNYSLILTFFKPAILITKMEEKMETVTSDFKNQPKAKSPLAVDQVNRHEVSSMEKNLTMEERLNLIRSKTAETYNSSIQLVRRNPVKSMALALGVGAAVGYLLKRR